MAYGKTQVVVSSLGVLLALLGVIGVVLLPRLFDKLLLDRLPLEVGSESYNGWKKIPFPISQKFYYFNITNPHEFLKKGAKPILQQVGPYVWRSEWVKEEVEWNANGTMQYRERKRYWFDEAQSVGSQDDVITTINTPLVAASQKIKNANPFIKLAVSIFLNAANETLFIKRSIRALTYEGYHDVLAQISHMLDPRVPVRNGKFAYMMGKNDTDEGRFNIFTGKENIADFNRIEKWNGLSKLPWWNQNSSCAAITGTNGELIHPISPSDDHIYFFNPVFCKPWKLSRGPDLDSFGLKVTRFVANADVLFNSTKDPKHKCFETPRASLPSGAMDLSRCQFGVPLVLSYPHFYAADPSLGNAVKGLDPQQEKHQFTIDIEPRMGIALGLQARAQINIKLQRVEYLKYFRHIPELVLPIFWQEIYIMQTPTFAEHIKDLLDKPLLYARGSFTLILVIGVICVFVGAVYFCILRRREQAAQKDGGSLLANEEEPNGFQGGDIRPDSPSPSSTEQPLTGDEHSRRGV